MKMKLLAMSVATIVAICSLGAKALAQDATPEQIAAEQKIATDAKLREILQAQKSAESLSKLTPEQIALRNLALERIKNTPPPPIPTNDGSALKPIRRTSKSASLSTPQLSPGDKLRLRTSLMTQLYFDGAISSQKNAEIINGLILGRVHQGMPTDTIIGEAYATAATLPKDDQAVLTFETSVATENDATIDAATSYVMQAVDDEMIADGGGIDDPQALMMTARTVDYTSNPYVPINIAPFPANLLPSGNGPWITYNVGTSYPWSSVPRTLVSSNGPSVRSYQFGTNTNGISRLRYVPTNHVNQLGKPVRHIFALWYTLTNLYSWSLVSDYARAYIYINYYNGNTDLSTNHFELEFGLTPNGWSRPAFLIDTMPNKTPSGVPGVKYYEMIFEVKKLNQPSRPAYQNPSLSIDPSVQWIPYWLPPIPEDFIIENVGNQAWVQWNTIAYPRDSYRLAFTTFLDSDSTNMVWSTSIGVPVTYTNEVATAKFAATNAMRFYRLQPL